jgi:hypothetical protein
MSDAARTELSADIPAEAPSQPVRPAWARLAGVLATDVGIGVVLAALLIATLLFSSGASKFVYIDF